jgi:hypothetical protein
MASHDSIRRNRAAQTFRTRETPALLESPIGMRSLAAVFLCAAPAFADAPRVPVLVELFTSEGCSSCPPADALLGRLLRDQPVAGAQIVALSEHVDYWNSLGWKDPFSDASFSERQERYEAFVGRLNPYTPQLIVDGRADVLGSDERGARAAIAAAAAVAHGMLRLEREKDSLRIAAALPRSDGVDLLFAVVEDDLTSRIERGENAGRTVTHWSVVRSFANLGAVSAAKTVPLRLDPKWRHVRAIAFAQEHSTGRVVASAALDL